MKILTTNFLTCPIKPCKSSPKSYPLHFRDAILERTELEFNPVFVRNILGRIDWGALRETATELGLESLVGETSPLDRGAGDHSGGREGGEAGGMDVDGKHAEEEEKGVDKTRDTEVEVEVSEEELKKLHGVLIETSVMEGKLGEHSEEQCMRKDAKRLYYEPGLAEDRIRRPEVLQAGKGAEIAADGSAR